LGTWASHLADYQLNSIITGLTVGCEYRTQLNNKSVAEIRIAATAIASDTKDTE